MFNQSVLLEKTHLVFICCTGISGSPAALWHWISREYQEKNLKAWNKKEAKAQEGGLHTTGWLKDPGKAREELEGKVVNL